MAEPRQSMRVAFWGQTSSGKTALLARYFEYVNSAEPTIDFVADKGTTEKLEKINRQIKVGAKFDEMNFATSSVDAQIHKFQCCENGKTEPLFHLEWVDYPGKWWGSEQSADSHERVKRKEFLTHLYGADVVFLLIDSVKWLIEGDQYIRKVLEEYATQIQEIKKSISVAEKRFDQFVIVLSKCDRQKERIRSAKDLKVSLETIAANELANLWSIIGAEPDEKRYLLISTCKADPEGKKVISRDTVGLDAIAPIAAMAMIAEAATSRRKLVASTSDGRTLKKVGVAGGGVGAAGGTLLSIPAVVTFLGTTLVSATGAGAIVLILGGAGAAVWGCLREENHADEEDKAKILEALSSALQMAEENLRKRSYYWDSKSG